MTGEGSKDAVAAPAHTAEAEPLVVRPDGLWLDDLQAGMTFHSVAYEVTPAEVADFASRYDPQPFHLDDDLARASIFRGLAASGWHTAAITMRLLDSTVEIATGIIGAEISLQWPSPTRAGDLLHLEVTVDTVSHSRSRPDRGSVVLSYDTVNQDGDVRQRTTGRVIAWRRPPR